MDDQYIHCILFGSSAGYESESNIGTSSADYLPWGRHQGPAIGSSDVDYYKFTADGSGTVTISLTRL